MTRIDLARASDLGSGIPEGTAFPGSPSTGDLFHRTDLTPALWRYDGTRWLCTCQHEVGIGGEQTLLPATVDSAVFRWPVRQDRGIYLDRIACVTFVTTTNSGAAFWTIAISRRSGANANTSIASFTTSADTANNWVNHDQAVGSVLDSSAREIQVQATPTGSPGSVYLPMTLIYRLIAT